MPTVLACVKNIGRPSDHLLPQKVIPFFIIRKTKYTIALTPEKRTSHWLSFDHEWPRFGISPKASKVRTILYSIINSTTGKYYSPIIFSLILTHRESDDAKAFCASRATGLVEMVTNTIHEKCLVVNQVRWAQIVSSISVLVSRRFLFK